MIFTTPHDKAKHLDSGIKSLKIRRTEDKDLLSIGSAAAEKKLQASLESEDPKKAVKNLSPLEFYYGVTSISPEYVKDALTYCSDEQFTKLFDLDCWNEGELDKVKSMSWLCKVHDRQNVGEKMLDRFRSLEEEYQLAMITSQVSFVDMEQYDLMKDHERSTYTPLPDHESFYKILNKDDIAQEFFEKMIQASMHHDIVFLFNFLAYATYAVPAESEFQLEQFRQARLEEDGFFSAAEASSVFVPTIEQPNEATEKTPATSTEIQTTANGQLFIERVLAELQQNQPNAYQQAREQLYYFANNLCSICQVEPNDIKGIQNILQRLQALCSLSLEHLSHGSIQTAAKLMHKEHPKNLFKIALGLVHKEQQKVMEQLSNIKAPGIEVLEKLFAQFKWGALQTEIDKSLSENMQLEDLEFLKGLFNRFPLLLDRSTAEDHFYEYTEINSLKQLAKLQEAVLKFNSSISLHFYN